ncbi:MAG: hypothetical protein KJ906_03980 [Nanoarchaeota archaeon]|nr:hypothetical protein [Nanoarchaeota archaeon]
MINPTTYNGIVVKARQPIKKTNKLLVKTYASKEIKKETTKYKPVIYDYKRRKKEQKIEKTTNEFFSVFSDREVKVLLLWALIGPFCALAYIIWLKNPRLRMLSVLFFMLNLVYLVGQLGGWLYIIPNASNILGSLF